MLKKSLMALALVGAAASAQAATLEYNGALFGLDYKMVGEDTTTYDVTYSLDTTGYVASGNQNYLAAINWKFGGSDTTSVSLVSGPGGAVAQDQSVTNNGCTGGGNQFVCVLLTSQVNMATDATYEWVFRVTFNKQIASDVGNPLRALFNEEANWPGLDGNGAGLMSCVTGEVYGGCTPTTVPVPGTLGLLGLGFAGLGLVRRKQKA